jgi:hypothetical protein
VKVDRQQCCAREITGNYFVKCYSSFSSYFNPSYPSSGSIHIHRSFTLHSEQTFVNACWFVTFKVRGRKGPITAHCFNCMSICHFRIKCGAAIYWVKQSLLMENNWECSGIHLCSGYSYTKECKEIRYSRHYFITALHSLLTVFHSIHPCNTTYYSPMVSLISLYLPFLPVW